MAETQVVTVYAPRGGLSAEAIEAALAPSFRAVFVRALDDLRTHARVVVVLAEALHPQDANRLAIGAFRAPIVVVGEPESSIAESIADSVFAQVSAATVEVSLLRVVAAAVAEDVMRTFRGRLLSSPELAESPKLHEALAAATAEPIASVKALARAVRRSPRTLERDWASTFGPATGSLKELLRRLAVLRAVHARLRDPERPWSSIAQSLSISSRTLRAYLMSYEVQPRRLDPRRSSEIVSRIERELCQLVISVARR
jgi:hypothetical protein